MTTKRFGLAGLFVTAAMFLGGCAGEMSDGEPSVETTTSAFSAYQRVVLTVPAVKHEKWIELGSLQFAVTQTAPFVAELDANGEVVHAHGIELAIEGPDALVVSRLLDAGYPVTGLHLVAELTTPGSDPASAPSISEIVVTKLASPPSTAGAPQVSEIVVTKDLNATRSKLAKSTSVVIRVDY